MAPYDAFLLVSFGGPEKPDDVIPFLRNVTAGRNVPTERLARVARHYHQFGGVSPINQQCRDLLAAVAEDFAARGVQLPVYWGNRNWDPYLADTLATMAKDGVTRAAIRSLPASTRDEFDLVFTAHSIPLGMAEASGPAGGAYQAQLAEAARLVAAELGHQRPWQLAYSSRSGPPSQPWLEPDINDVLADRASAGSRAVVVVPIGFVSDHMEVKFDLDVEAAEAARRLGLAFARAATPGTDPRFVSMITDLVCERLDSTTPLALGVLGAGPDVCPSGCCGGALARRAP